MKGYDLRFKQVTIINGKVLVDTNLVNNYQVKGIAKKNTEKSEYYVDSEKTTKGYDYNASATGTETVKLQKIFLKIDMLLILLLKLKNMNMKRK